MPHTTNRAQRRGDAGPKFLIGLAGFFAALMLLSVILGAVTR